MNVLSKGLERLLLIIMCFLSSSIFFLLYHAEQKLELTQNITKDFLTETCTKGKISYQDYEKLLNSLSKLGGYNATLLYTSYGTEPHYDYYEESVLDSFFERRNVRREKEVKSELPEVEVVDIEELSLQGDSAINIIESFLYDKISAGLPQDDYTIEYTHEAAVPNQEVYVGEPLVTTLLASAFGVSYIKEADYAAPSHSGIYTVPIKIGGENVGAEINVTVWDKTVTCANGHEYPCTKEVIEHYKNTNLWEMCPYCASYVKNIEMTPNEYTTSLGSSANGLPIIAVVTYMDGHTEEVPFSSIENDYDSQYAGEQEVTLSYKGVTQTCKITTICPACPKCGGPTENRNAADTKEYPYCNLCLHGEPTFIGECIDLSVDYPHQEITSALESVGEYKMTRGGYLMIEISRNEGKNPISMIFSTDKNTYYRMGKTVYRDAD